MRHEEVIAGALKVARNQRGVTIHPGAVFDWSGSRPELPSTCNAVGAVLLLLGSTRSKQLPFKAFDEHLGVGLLWVYRFHMGFDRDRQLQAPKLDKRGSVLRDASGDPIMVDDKVSAMGRRLRRAFCPGFDR